LVCGGVFFLQNKPAEITFSIYKPIKTTTYETNKMQYQNKGAKYAKQRKHAKYRK
jgi:hypothetical protein